jgi:hypothetical protein
MCIVGVKVMYVLYMHLQICEADITCFGSFSFARKIKFSKASHIYICCLIRGNLTKRYKQTKFQSFVMYVWGR